MFTDKITLKLSAGKGGNGIIAWRREKYIPKGGPAGGDGGNGGSIVFQVDSNLFSLESLRNRHHVKAENGKDGGRGNKKGRNGKDLIIKIPPGTFIKDKNTKSILLDCTSLEKNILCRGGRGGKGNSFFKTSTHRAPIKATKGKPGEITEIELELKLIADIGLIGFPNAGKSTLLSSLSHVNVKIAPYPFTTLRPNLGVIECEDYSRLIIADIPGIISGAHKNKGLGLSFLKHIERTNILIFVIDLAMEDGRDPFLDFISLVDELKAYSTSLLQKPKIIVLNKHDKKIAKKQFFLFHKKFNSSFAPIFPISSITKEGFTPLLRSIQSLSQKDQKKQVLLKTF